jgi:hypothetical protein
MIATPQWWFNVAKCVHKMRIKTCQEHEKKNGLLLVGLRPIRKNEIDYSSCTTWKS